MHPDGITDENVLVVVGTRGDFEALVSMLSHEHFVYEPRGLAAARAYDCIREALEAEVEEEEDVLAAGERIVKEAAAQLDYIKGEPV